MPGNVDEITGTSPGAQYRLTSRNLAENQDVRKDFPSA